MARRRVTAVARAAPLEDASPGSRLPSMRLQSGASENCQAGFRGGPSPGEGVAFLWAWAGLGPGLLRNSGSTFSASVTVCCQRGVTIVPAWWGVGNGVRIREKYLEPFLAQQRRAGGCVITGDCAELGAH